MYYHFSKTVAYQFDEAIAKVTEELAKEGFGIVTELDIQQTLKNKLNIDFRRYKVLGACNPQSAYEALQAEDKMGTMLPCNVVVQEHENGKVEISIVDPLSYLLAFKNEKLERVLSLVREKLETVFDNL